MNTCNWLISSLVQIMFVKWLVLWIDLTKGVYIYEKSFEMCICLWPEFDCPEVTQCSWQDITIQLLTNRYVDQHFLFIWTLVKCLEMSPKCFTVATIALFSASMLTHCTFVVCSSELSEWLALHSTFWISTEVVTALCSYMAGAVWNCCHQGPRSVYTMQQFTASLHLKPHK